MIASDGMRVGIWWLTAHEAGKAMDLPGIGKLPFYLYTQVQRAWEFELNGSPILLSESLFHQDVSLWDVEHIVLSVQIQRPARGIFFNLTDRQHLVGLGGKVRSISGEEI